MHPDLSIGESLISKGENPGFLLKQSIGESLISKGENPDFLAEGVGGGRVSDSA
jgi:hypothetical protein